MLRELSYHHLLDRGIFIASRGFLALTVKITDEHCARILRAVEEFLDKYRSALI